MRTKTSCMSWAISTVYWWTWIMSAPDLISAKERVTCSTSRGCPRMISLGKATTMLSRSSHQRFTSRGMCYWRHMRALITLPYRVVSARSDSWTGKSCKVSQRKRQRWHSVSTVRSSKTWDCSVNSDQLKMEVDRSWLSGSASTASSDALWIQSASTTSCSFRTTRTTSSLATWTTCTIRTWTMWRRLTTRTTIRHTIQTLCCLASLQSFQGPQQTICLKLIRKTPHGVRNQLRFDLTVGRRLPCACHINVDQRLH